VVGRRGTALVFAFLLVASFTLATHLTPGASLSWVWTARGGGRGSARPGTCGAAQEEQGRAPRRRRKP
jgi:hypothetical protein